MPARNVRVWDELVRPRHGLKCAHFLMAMLAESDFSNTTIRRFDILRLIARGGMGEVYVARDSVLGRDLALKIRSEEHTSELQSQSNLVCRLLLEKKKKKNKTTN